MLHPGDGDLAHIAAMVLVSKTKTVDHEFRIKNAAGEFVSPSADAASKAMATAEIPDDFRFSMVNAPGSGAYPIAGASWVLIYQKQTKGEVGRSGSRPTAPPVPSGWSSRR